MSSRHHFFFCPSEPSECLSMSNIKKILKNYFKVNSTYHILNYKKNVIFSVSLLTNCMKVKIKILIQNFLTRQKFIFQGKDMFVFSYKKITFISFSTPCPFGNQQSILIRWPLNWLGGCYWKHKLIKKYRFFTSPLKFSLFSCVCVHACVRETFVNMILRKI